MTVEEVRKSLDQVEDPELKLSIIELGLVYDVRLEAREEGQHGSPPVRSPRLGSL